MTKEQNFIMMAMTELNLNQSQFAKKLGCARSTVSQWVSGVRTPNNMTIKLITSVLIENTKQVNSNE